MSTQLEKEPVRRPVAVILVLLCLVALGSGTWYYTHRTKAPENPSITPAALAEQHRKTEAVPAPASTEQSPANVASSTATPTMPATVPTRAETSRRPEPSAESRQLIKNLLQIDFSKGPITAEQAASWKTQVTNLVQAGATAVPAIREFLEQNKDLAFDPKLGGNQLGSPTLRLALLKALQDIGGPEALQLAFDTLKTTTQPREIAQIAQHLETDAPEQYRAAILDATRESIGMATSGKLGDTDAGPLFGLLARYGGEGALGDLQGASSTYRYYSAIGLAELPNGAGIPALGQMLREPNGPPKSTQTPAIEALAQLVPLYPEAGARLIEQARYGQIPDTLWPSIANSICGGRLYIGNPSELGLTPQSGDKTYHLSFRNQNFYSRPNVVQLTPEQIQQSRAFANQLLQMNLSPVAAEALRGASCGGQ